MDLRPQSMIAYPRSGTIEAAESIIPLAVVLVVAPMANGSAPAWAWHALAIAMGVNLGWWGVCVLRAPIPVGLPWRLHGVTTVLGCVLLAWLALQAARLDLVPDTWRHPVWKDVSTTLGIDIVGAISADPDASRDGFIRMMLYAATFWIAMHYARPRDGARRLLSVIAAAGALYGAMGLILWATDMTPVFAREGAAGGLAGTFPQPGSMAVYLGLCAVAATTLVSSRHIVSAFTAGNAEDPGGIVRDPAGEAAALVPAIAIIGAALVLTGSPVGWIAVTAGAAVLVAARAVAERAGLGPSILIGLAVAGCGLAAIHLFGGGAPIPGLDMPASAHLGRGFGVGAVVPAADGASGSAIPLSGGVALARYDGVRELVAQAGLPAALLLLGILGWIAAACARGCFPGRDQAAYAAAGIAAMALLGCQAVLDAGALTPAVCVTAVSIMAVGFSQSWPRDGDAPN